MNVRLDTDRVDCLINVVWYADQHEIMLIHQVYTCLIADAA